MSTPAIFFGDIAAVHASGSLTLTDKYPRLRTILEQACKELTRNEPVQFNNLFARQTYLAKKWGLDKEVNRYLNGLRVTANDILHSHAAPKEDAYHYHLKALCEALALFFGSE